MVRTNTRTICRLVIASAVLASGVTVLPSGVAAAAGAPKITGISVSRGPLGGGTDVVVVGTGFTTRTTVSFGGAKARKVTRASSTRLIARSPAHAKGTIHVRVKSSGRISAKVKAARFIFTAAPGRLTWRRPVPVTDQTAVSCASAQFCASVGESGKTATFRAGTWTVSTMPDTARMTAVSCPTSTFCAATDALGRTAVYNGTTWSAPLAHTGVRELTALSCPTTTFCMTTDGYATLRFNGSTWTRRAMGSTTLTGLDCTSPTFCLAVSEHRNQTTWNGKEWSRYVRALPANLLRPTLDCTTPAYCVVAGVFPFVYVRHGTTWSTSVSLDIRGEDGGSDFDTSGLSCASDSFCLIGLKSADESSLARPFQSASVASPAASIFPSTPIAFSCPTTRFCAAAGSDLVTGTR